MRPVKSRYFAWSSAAGQNGYALYLRADPLPNGKWRMYHRVKGAKDDDAFLNCGIHKITAVTNSGKMIEIDENAAIALEKDYEASNES